MKKIFCLLLLIITLTGCGSSKGNTDSLEEQSGHDHVYKKVTLVSATCTTEGTSAYKCEICNKIQAESVIPALGHNYETKVLKKASCRENGEQEEVCKRCGDVKNHSSIEHLDHLLYLDESLKDNVLSIDYSCGRSNDYHKYHCVDFTFEPGSYSIASGMYNKYVASVNAILTSYIIVNTKSTINGETIYQFAIIKFGETDLPYDNSHCFLDYTYEEKKEFYTKNYGGVIQKEIVFKVVMDELTILETII